MADGSRREQWEWTEVSRTRRLEGAVGEDGDFKDEEARGSSGIGRRFQGRGGLREQWKRTEVSRARRLEGAVGEDGGFKDEEARGRRQGSLIAPLALSTPCGLIQTMTFFSRPIHPHRPSFTPTCANR